MTKEVSKTNTQVATTGVKGLSEFLNSEAIKKKFTDVLGQKGVGFISSVLSVVASDKALANADRNSIYNAALLAASLDLPINQNLGLAYIIGYNTKQADGSYKQMAQFQLGFKGFKQLALRTGQFTIMNDEAVKEGELIEHNRMTGEIKFNWIQDSQERLKRKTIGYLSYFRLVNGFESTFYMTVAEVDAHAKKYSQGYKKWGTGLWKDEFDLMALKTVTKMNLSKNAPLSVEMQKAVVSDQAVIKNDNFINEDTIDVETQYVDNEPEQQDHEAISEHKAKQRVLKHIEESVSLAQLKQVEGELLDDELQEAYNTRLLAIKSSKKKDDKTNLFDDKK